MNKETLKRVIVDQRQELEKRFCQERVLEREGIKPCMKYLVQPNLLLVSGMRRAGKSFFAHILAGKNSYAFLNFDDERLMGFVASDFNNVLECFNELYGEPPYLLFDEIQNVKGWELFAGRLRNTAKVIITGSNANLLSRELSTHLTGRFMEYVLHPMSFKEFCGFKKESVENNELYSTTKRAHVSHLLSEYLINGGIFDSYKFGPEFLRTLWRSVVDRDIIIRYRVRYPSTLEQLALLLLNSFGTKISTAKLTRQYNIKSQHTVKDYIHYLENVFLLFSVNKFSYKLKEQQTSFKKMYISDNGFIQALGFSFSENNGRLLENAVASELKRRCQLTNSVLYYWDDYHFECDFVVKTGKKINALYQVCSELKPENRDREVKGLIAAMKVFKINSGRIITMSQEDSIKEDRYKIDVIPAWRWFLETHE